LFCARKRRKSSKKKLYLHKNTTKINKYGKRGSMREADTQAAGESSRHKQ
jgi:hypothetical protein